MQELTQDLFLGGALKVHQPKTGYRAGSDTVLLAAAINAQANESVLDVGCGVGVVGLCVARRVIGVRLVGIDLQKDLVDLASQNALENGLSDRAHFFHHDIRNKLPLEIKGGSFDWVAANPPYYNLENHDVAKGDQRATSRSLVHGDLNQWVDFCFKMTKPRGHMVFIYPAEHMEKLIGFLVQKKVGGLTLYPLWPKLGHAAKRILILARKGVSSPSKIFPGLILHDDQGNYTSEALKILKDGEKLMP